MENKPLNPNENPTSNAPQGQPSGAQGGYGYNPQQQQQVGYPTYPVVYRSAAGQFPGGQQQGGQGYYNRTYGANGAAQQPAGKNGLPQTVSIDEFGRVYTPTLSYGPIGGGGPIPIPTPSQYIQLAPIVAPVAFVPYSSQEQPVYQHPDFFRR